MVKCPDCGEEVPEEKFCKNCGASLSDVKEEKEEFLPVEVTKKEDNNNETARFCQKCGFRLTEDYKVCPKCGYDFKSELAVRNPNKSMVLAILLSVILPGVGQFYLGLPRKGMYLLIAYIISWPLFFVFIGMILLPIVWVWALIDTIMSANSLKNGEAVKDKVF